MIPIAVFDHMAASGLALLDSTFNLQATIQEAQGVLLRSTQLDDASFSSNTRLVVRAGAGTNHIPIDALSDRGIPVENTPGANANAVNELVFASLLSSKRSLLSAAQFVHQLDWTDADTKTLIEKNKKQFMGSEIKGLRFGVIGLGRIGVQVANTALALGLEVLGYDPHMGIENSWQLSSQVQRASQLSEIMAQCDVISLHVPLNKHTRGLINTQALSACKKTGVHLLNFARQEIVDHAALMHALSEKTLTHFTTDFPHPDYAGLSAVTAFPHLGASTQQAQENCATMACNQLKQFFTCGSLIHCVNFPSLKLTPMSGPRLCVMHRNVPGIVSLISQTCTEHAMNIVQMHNVSRDSLAYTVLDLDQPFTKEQTQHLQQQKGILRIHTPHGLNA